MGIRLTLDVHKNDFTGNVYNYAGFDKVLLKSDEIRVFREGKNRIYVDGVNLRQILDYIWAGKIEPLDKYAWQSLKTTLDNMVKHTLTKHVNGKLLVEYNGRDERRCPWVDEDNFITLGNPKHYEYECYDNFGDSAGEWTLNVDGEAEEIK